MKAMLSLSVFLALATLAQAQDALVHQDALVQPKPIERVPVPNLHKNQWQVDTIKSSSDGLHGSSTTAIKRHIGPHLWLGGQMRSPYREPALGGQGASGNPIQGVRNGTAAFGPVLEMRF